MRYSKAIVFLLGFGTLVANAKAEQKSTPFIAGFDRFAMHNEIEQDQAGRLLLRELNCTACHPSKESHLRPKGGPRLNGAGLQWRPEWIKRFLASPQEAKPGTTMPEMLAGWPDAEKSKAIEALTAFLSSQREEFPDVKASGLVAVPFEFWAKGDPAVGKRLYHQVGCVACHEADSNYETVETKPSDIDRLLDQLDPEELAELGLAAKARSVASVPHGDLPAKYTHKSLTFFLLDPERTRPSGRMPSLKLTATESADIAAYLLRDQKPNAEIDPQNASEATSESGRKLFADLGCANCHEATGAKPSVAAKPLDQLLSNLTKQSCLTGGSRGLPDFALNTEQVNALIAVLMEKDPRELTSNQRLELSMLQLNCHACHERDDRGGVARNRKAYFETVGNVDIGDEGRLPPPLTGVGAKLQTAWMSQVLKGTGDVRTHMRIRMPRFPANAVKELPTLFAEADHPPGKPQSEAAVFGQFDKLAEPGRLLLDNGCIECHTFRGEALPGVVGVDLEGIAKRVHPQWFHDFLLNPGSLKPRTRMPTFFPGGVSQNKNVLAGDADRQIAAMWAYLKALDNQPLPEKIEAVRSQDFELKPQDRPIVLRTFMQEAGTHAVAVGFPEGVHFAFDSEHSRLAVAWRGRFLDAQGTWYSRFTPPAEPLGTDLMVMSDGVPIAMLNQPDGRWPKIDPLAPTYRYLGYRLDEKGVPTFLYRYNRFDIEDRIEPHGERHIKRLLKITHREPTGPAPDVWFRPITGKTVKYRRAFTYANDVGLTIAVSESIGHTGELRQTEAGMEWRIPLAIKNEQTIEVRYEW